MTSTEQVRLYNEEIRLLTREETLAELKSFQKFLSESEEALRDYQRSDSYPMMKGYEKKERIEELRKRITREKSKVTRVHEALYGLGQPVTRQELDIRVFGYPKLSQSTPGVG